MEIKRLFTRYQDA